MAEVLDVVYNVMCMDCGTVFTPRSKSSLWWQAHKRANEGYLDALYVSAENHGCVVTRSPDAPFRVFGYTMDAEDFDMPFNSFTAAMKCYIEMVNRRSIVCITGVSVAVKSRLSMMSP